MCFNSACVCVCVLYFYYVAGQCKCEISYITCLHPCLGVRWGQQYHKLVGHSSAKRQVLVSQYLSGKPVAVVLALQHQCQGRKFMMINKEIKQKLL